MSALSKTKPTDFVLIGAGWRADFYLRIAAALPEHFRVVGALVRDKAKGQTFEGRWQVPTYRDLKTLLKATSPRFAVISTPWAMTPVFIKDLAAHDLPVLAETPPAPDLAELKKLQPLIKRKAKVQVAEQYIFQPLHAARLELLRSGKLGTISQVQVSVAHGYHAMSLMRAMLGVTFENASITAKAFSSKLVEGSDRSGPPKKERIIDSRQVIAYVDFGHKLGVYDFTGDQYFSWIRGPRLLVRGERGELDSTQLRYLKEFDTPVSLELKRVDAGHDGNLEGYFHQGIFAGDTCLYRNSFSPARLSDEEIAIATCLEKMAVYAEGGPSFYSLAEAAQDHYLSIMIDQALESQSTIRTKTQLWAR
jgi:Oxidoreductase family, NAD-binding Rossmann fold